MYKFMRTNRFTEDDENMGGEMCDDLTWNDPSLFAYACVCVLGCVC